MMGRISVCRLMPACSEDAISLGRPEGPLCSAMHGKDGVAYTLVGKKRNIGPLMQVVEGRVGRDCIGAHSHTAEEIVLRLHYCSPYHLVSPWPANTMICAERFSDAYSHRRGKHSLLISAYELPVYLKHGGGMTHVAYHHCVMSVFEWISRDLLTTARPHASDLEHLLDMLKQRKCMGWLMVVLLQLCLTHVNPGRMRDWMNLDKCVYCAIRICSTKGTACILLVLVFQATEAHARPAELAIASNSCLMRARYNPSWACF